MSVKLIRASSFTSIDLSEVESTTTQGTNSDRQGELEKIVIYCDDQFDKKSIAKTLKEKRKKRSFCLFVRKCTFHIKSML